MAISNPSDPLVLGGHLPDLDIVNVVSCVMARFPPVKILVIADHDCALYSRALVRMGVSGVLDWTATGLEIALTVRLIASGKKPVALMTQPSAAGESSGFST